MPAGTVKPALSCRKEFVPSSSPPTPPEVQPAETLWTLVDEPIVNKHVPDLETLDKVISARCAALVAERPKIKSQAGFHWWPNIANPR